MSKGVHRLPGIYKVYQEVDSVQDELVEFLLTLANMLRSRDTAD